MAMKKADRYKREKVNQSLKGNFPVEKFIYEGKNMTLLGTSNKTDLFPKNLEEPGLIKASMTGKIGQFIYSCDNGDLYDALLYIDETGTLVLYSIRTRLQ